MDSSYSPETQPGISPGPGQPPLEPLASGVSEIPSSTPQPPSPHM